AGIVDQDHRRRRRRAVPGPYPLAAAVLRVVEHAIAEHRTVAEYIHHQRDADARGVLQTGTHAAARAQVAQLAGRPVTGVIVVTAHGDRAGAREATDNHLHVGRGLAELGVA